MQIQEMNPELYEALHEIWLQNEMRMPDVMRPAEVLDTLLLEDGGATKFYLVEDQPALAVVGEINPGLSATVMLLNHEFSEVGAILRELRAIIEEFDLRRLTAQVPGPVKDLQRALQMVGFRREGHLRRAIFWNDKLVGLDIYGMYRDPARDQRYRNDRPQPQEAVSA